MRNLYIGIGQRKKNNSGLKWKLSAFLIMFLAIIGAGLKVAGPTIVEKWLNRQGEGEKGYAFSIRDVELSLEKGQIILTDVKVFNPKTSTEILKTPELTIQLNLQDLIQTSDKKVLVFADKLDIILSKDLTSEIERIKAARIVKNDLYLNAVEAKISKLNIIEQKESTSRVIFELADVDFKVKDVSVNAINKNTEFSVTSNMADGGKLNLTGKTHVEDGGTPWTINGSLKNVPADIFNKIAGDKLPFAFNESSFNAQISAQSDNGVVSGQITPDIRKLNIIVEKPGVPTQSIARLLNDELAFSLPFTLKDEVKLDYEDTYSKLKSYRKYPMATASTEPANKKEASFWSL